MITTPLDGSDSTPDIVASMSVLPILRIRSLTVAPVISMGAQVVLSFASNVTPAGLSL